MQSVLDAVSCPAAGSCTAVGQKTSGYRVEPLAERLAASAWQPVPVAPAGRSSELTAVSCSGASFCMAVGGQPRGGALSEIWRGAGWMRQRVAVPGGAPVLDGVSCLRPRFCLAVGATKLEHSLGERWNGTSWLRTETPDWNAEVVEPLRGVSCSFANVCIAVGTTYSQASQSPVIDVYRDHAWSRLTVPAATTGGTLRGISCVATPRHASWCLAVGSIGSGATRRPLAVAIAGTAVTALAPLPGAGTSLAGVNCVAVEHCIAIGVKVSRSGLGIPFAERLWPTGWKLVPPSSRASTVLPAGVSCAPKWGCEAVGSSFDPLRRTVTASAQRLRGGVWSSLVLAP